MSRMPTLSPNSTFGSPLASQRSARAIARRALPWLRGFGRPIAKVIGLAMLLAAATAAAPLAVMRLVDTLAHVAAKPDQLPAGAGSTILLALGLVAGFELAQVYLTRLLEARSWRVRLALDFSLRQRVTARLHQLPLSFHQQQTVGGTVSKVNTSI